ncbi:unnamed protein product [Mytilus edulis]|uniref:Uncharacterized protein n=1 Tax=Mytilus edulis TaxID=6550 RepID=A0A8S3RUX7_MYTED|nr:unnamed protein product [Mytilus edulis]
MSLSTLRKNFYRISTLIIEHAADAMRILLHHFIQKNYKISFKAFVEKHQHELYHQFNIAICCQCPTSYRRPCKPIISSMQMETLFDNNCPKLPCHKHSSKCDYCCSTVKQDLKLKDIDITLLRFFLVTYFEEELWQDCLTDVVSFQEFLNKNKHDIFHLVQLKTKCCLCMENPNYTVMVGARKDKLTNHQWKTMFSAAP